jgi:class I fructose-bisphosphate aldolase
MIDTPSALEALLGDEAESLLDHTCDTIPKDQLHWPGPDFVDRIGAGSDRNPRVLRSLQALFGHGRLGGTGYLSMLPVDHGITRGAGSAFAVNPLYFDPENILQLAIEGGCSTVVTTYGVLGSIARRYAHKIPLTLKLDHDEILSVPRRERNVPFAQVEEAWKMGCVAVGATVYFGAPHSRERITQVARAFSHAHELGMATILFCYLRNEAFRTGRGNYERSADLTGQANHMGATIEADFVKQKQPTLNGGYRALNMDESSYGKLDERIYTDLATDHPIDLTRYQVANGYMGRCGLINSGGGSAENDLQQAVRTAVINKRAGGMGLISGRKAFQKPMGEGVEILNAIQDVYRSQYVTIA